MTNTVLVRCGGEKKTAPTCGPMPPMPLGGFILIGPPMFGCPEVKQEECSSLELAHKWGGKRVCGQYLEVCWGPGCLAKEAVTQGCSPEAGLAYGGRVLAHLGTAETWMAVGRKREQSQACFPYQNRVASIQLNNIIKFQDWGLGLIRVTATIQIHRQVCSMKAAEVI